MLKADYQKADDGEKSCPNCGSKFVFSTDNVRYETYNAGNEVLRLLTLRCTHCSWEGAWRVDENGDLLVLEGKEARRNLRGRSAGSLDLEPGLLKRAYRTARQTKQIESLQAQIANLEKKVADHTPSKVRELGVKKHDFSRFFDAAKLTAKQHEVATLVWEYELTVMEIAKRLGKHHSTVQYLKARVQNKMEFLKMNRVKLRPKKDWEQ